MVKIIQISVVRQQETDNFYPRNDVYGLGEDNNIYWWKNSVGKWVLDNED